MHASSQQPIYHMRTKAIIDVLLNIYTIKLQWLLSGNEMHTKACAQSKNKPNSTAYCE